MRAVSQYVGTAHINPSQEFSQITVSRDEGALKSLALLHLFRMINLPFSCFENEAISFFFLGKFILFYCYSFLLNPW